ncbi:hypothetical protein IV203_008888 [Nitzschia inconspicua]|uniref:Uncharacterized protein n=1 Tax=Nitzschia inconspicua TaxID=303405 RepID=A0A9K3PME9_9STRA|nr:hypothetical protein IV203_008888 [Nitzschia inconspicua]
MKQLGMKYANHKKSYYVHGHERQDVVTSRELFCKRYLVDLEPRCIRWIQITKEKAAKLQSLSMEFGREYMEGDIVMVEFHEDYIDKASLKLTQFKNETKRAISTQITVAGVESPFVRRLLIGIKNEGYENSKNMAVQFEDVVDCLKVLYPHHEFVFLFDHSQGHNRKRKGALDANNMNVNFGGKQERSKLCRLPGTLLFTSPSRPYAAHELVQ